MNTLVTVIMAVALGLLIVFSLAPALGFFELNETQFISGGLGITGGILLVIMGIGGMIYWAGGRK